MLSYFTNINMTSQILDDISIMQLNINMKLQNFYANSKPMKKKKIMIKNFSKKKKKKRRRRND